MRRFLDDLTDSGTWDWYSVFLIGGVVVTGTVVVLFDVLKKTVFLGAAWNYDYPAYTFVYNIPVTALLVLVGVLLILALPKHLSISRPQFVALLYLSGVTLYGLSFFALPEKSQQLTMQPSKGVYNATVYLVENGPVAYFGDFHSLGLDGAGAAPESMLRTAELLSEFLRESSYVPFNQQLAEYAGGIRTNLHGPITPILVAPFLVLFGTSIGSSILGSYLISATFPVIAYYTFRLYFDEFESRSGAWLVLFSPAFFIYLREKTIPYDPIMGVVSALATYAFLLGVIRRDLRYVLAGGSVFSLAALIKVSALPLGLALVIIAFIELDGPDAVRSAISFSTASLALPVGLLFLGYNFIVQYLYAIARLFVNAQDFDTAEGSLLFVPPDLNIQNPVLVVLATYYNIRLVGLPLLILAIAFLLYAVRYRTMLSQERYAIGATFVIAILPILPHMQLQFARHLLGVFIAMGFLGVCGLALLSDRFDHEGMVRFVQVSLVVTFTLALINL